MEKTTRQELIELQAKMAEEQKAAAKKLQELLHSERAKALLAEIEDLRESSIPGQYLEQSIEHIKVVTDAVKTQLDNNLGALVVPEPAPEETDVEPE